MKPSLTTLPDGTSRSGQQTLDIIIEKVVPTITEQIKESPEISMAILFVIAFLGIGFFIWLAFNKFKSEGCDI